MKKLLKKFNIVLIVLAVLMSTEPSWAYYNYNSSTESPFDGVKYSSYKHGNSDVSFKNNVILNGVDISAWQDDISTSKMKKSAIDFAIIRVSWTGTGSKFSCENKDTNFAYHYKAAKDSGKLIGAYVFSQAKTVTEARKEAEFAVKTLKAAGVKPGDLNMPLYMDYEYAADGRITYKNLSKITATRCAIAFCEKVKALGYTPGIYANLNFLTYSIDGKTLSKFYDVWCAQYYNKCEYTNAYSKWQYSSAAKISCIDNGKANVDADFWYINKEACSKSGSTIKVYGKKTYTYTGNFIKPSYTLYYNDQELIKGTDYSIGYINNLNTSTSTKPAYAYVHGIGKYDGEILIPFSIIEKPVEKVTLSETSVESSEPAQETVEEIEEESNSDIVEKETGEEVAEEAPVEELESADESQDAASSTLIDVKGKGLCKKTSSHPMTVKLSGKTYYYNGSAKKPTVTIAQNGSTIASAITASTSKVGMKYPSGRKLPGTYYIYMYSKKYPAIATAEFYIKIKPTTIEKLTSGKGYFKATAGKLASKYVTGYQLKYSSYSDMSKAKTLTIGTRPTEYTKKVTKLVSGKKYYVRVRTYKVVNSKKHYSSWSPKKSIKVR